MQLDSTLIAVGLSTLVLLLSFAAAWGSLWAKVRSIDKHLATQNGHIADNRKRLGKVEQRVAHIEGAGEHQFYRREGD